MSETNGNGTAALHPQMVTDAEKLSRQLLEHHRNVFKRELVKDLEEFQHEKKRSAGKIISEAAVDFYGIVSANWDVYDFSQDTSPDGWSSYPFYLPPWYRQSQKRGEVLPVYLNEIQLRFLRDRSRKLCAENPFAQACIENRVNYCIGNKLDIKCIVDPQIPERDAGQEAQRLVDKAQRVIDRWSVFNRIPSWGEWLMMQPDINGDGLIRHFFRENGLVVHRPVECEHLRSPAGDAYGPHYSFGIQTDPHDIMEVEGYWIVDDPILGLTPGFVPRKEITHLKRFTPLSAKRGMPMFYSTELLLRSAIDLLRAVITTAVNRAKYSVIRKWTNNTVKDAISKLTNELATVATNDPITGASQNVQKKPFGSITDIGSNQEIDFPGSNLDAGVFEVALQMVLRACAARTHVPEWMFTADISEASYNNSFVAEAPSTKNFERLQGQICEVVGKDKVKGRESMAWLQIQHAVRCGILDSDTLKVVALTCEGPSIISRNKGEEASVNSMYLQAKIKPRTMIQQEQGVDPKQAKKMFIEEARDDAEVAAQSAQDPNQQALLAQQQGIDPSTGLPANGSPTQGATPGLGQQNGPTDGIGAPGRFSGQPSPQSLLGGIVESKLDSLRTDYTYLCEELKNIRTEFIKEPPDRVITVPVSQETFKDSKSIEPVSQQRLIPQEQDHKFSCIYLPLNRLSFDAKSDTEKDFEKSHPYNKILSMTRRINDGDLVGKGREDTPHLTVKFGLYTDDARKVAEVIHKFGKAITVMLGKSSIFPAREASEVDAEHFKDKERYDVVKVDVESSELKELNNEICNSLKYTDKFDTYKPHITLATVKDGAGRKYIGWSDVSGTKITFQEVCFVDHDDNKIYISLVKKPGYDLEGEYIDHKLMEAGLYSSGPPKKPISNGRVIVHWTTKSGHKATAIHYFVNGKQVKGPSHEHTEEKYTNARQHYKIQFGEEPPEDEEKHIHLGTEHDIPGGTGHAESYERAGEIAHKHLHGEEPETGPEPRAKDDLEKIQDILDKEKSEKPPKRGPSYDKPKAQTKEEIEEIKQFISDTKQEMGSAFEDRDMTRYHAAMEKLKLLVAQLPVRHRPRKEFDPSKDHPEMEYMRAAEGHWKQRAQARLKGENIKREAQGLPPLNELPQPEYNADWADNMEAAIREADNRKPGQEGEELIQDFERMEVMEGAPAQEWEAYFAEMDSKYHYKHASEQALAIARQTAHDLVHDREVRVKNRDGSYSTITLPSPLKDKYNQFKQNRSAASLVAHVAARRGASYHEAESTARFIDSIDEFYQSGISEVVSKAIGKHTEPGVKSYVAQAVALLPLAKLSYLAYSTIRNPMKTLFGAKDVTLALQRSKKPLYPPLGKPFGSRLGYSPSYGQSSHMRGLQASQAIYNRANAAIKRYDSLSSVADHREGLHQMLNSLQGKPFGDRAVLRDEDGQHILGSFNAQQIQGILAYQEHLDSGGEPFGPATYDQQGNRVSDPQHVRISTTGYSTTGYEDSASPEYWHRTAQKRNASIRSKLAEFQRAGFEQAMRPRDPTKGRNPDLFQTAFADIGSAMRRASGGGDVNIAAHIPDLQSALASHTGGGMMKITLPGMASMELNRRQVEKIVDWADMDAQLQGMSHSTPTPPIEVRAPKSNALVTTEALENLEEDEELQEDLPGHLNPTTPPPPPTMESLQEDILEHQKLLKSLIEKDLVKPDITGIIECDGRSYSYEQGLPKGLIAKREQLIEITQRAIAKEAAEEEQHQRELAERVNELVSSSMRSIIEELPEPVAPTIQIPAAPKIDTRPLTEAMTQQEQKLDMIADKLDSISELNSLLREMIKNQKKSRDFEINRNREGEMTGFSMKLREGEELT